MIVMPTLEDAIMLALHAHRGQVDKAGRPYILHPLRVMGKLSTEFEQMAGVLHDVIEDSSHTIESLRAAGYPEGVLEALACLTRQQGESYEQFIERVQTNPLARRVKLADLEDNMNIRRLPDMTEEDLARVKKYRRAWGRLTGIATDSQ